MSWTANVPVVVDGQTTFSASGLNPTINALTERTQYLYDSLMTLSGNQGYLLPDTGFTAGCSKGVIVAQNPTTGLYEPASATWSTAVRADGSWLPSYKAYVRGILISTVDSNSGAVLICNGWSNDPELIELLAPGRVVGDYYLTENGIAVCGNDVVHDMRVYCYSYLASGKLFIKPELPEYGGHAHNHVTITTEWLAASQSTVTLPETAEYFTDVSSNSALSYLLSANPNGMCLVKNGQEVMASDWGVVENCIYINFPYLSTDEFSLHAITPLTANEPLVRSVSKASGNNLIDIQTTDGKVFISVNDTPVSASAYTGTAVTNFSANGISTGPVIQGIKAGPGIKVAQYVDNGVTVPGVQVVTATQFAGTMTDLSICNLNRVVLGTTFNGISYVFPAGVTSQLTGTIRIPRFESTSQEGSLIFVFQGNDSTISGLTASVLIQPTPTVGESSAISVPVDHTVPAVNGTSSGNCYSQIVSLGGSEGQTLFSDGLLICKLQSSGVTAVTVLSVSLRLS